jgi:hypothetical protein
MYKQQRMSNFIGRNKEVETFMHWLTGTNAPWILYIHDAAEEADKKGGVGKTWLLRRCADIARQKCQDIAVAMADFFNIGDRDYPFLTGKILADRNELDWQHPNWQGCTPEVQVIALTPFDLEEMREYVEVESTYDIPLDSDTFRALYDRTEGRPIILGLAVNMLNNRITMPCDMLSVSKTQFEQYLVPQINQLENSLDWVILFMTHVYYRFSVTLLERILQSVPLNEPVQSIEHDELVKLLPELSFVHRPDVGDDFVLHDEMRRLVTDYCWLGQDPDRRFRRDISCSVIGYQVTGEYVRSLLGELHNRELFIIGVDLV